MSTERYRNAVVVLFSLIFIVSPLSGCGKEMWDTVVIAEVDELTSEPTGLFKTFGPTQHLIIEDITVPVTVGYWCRVVDAQYDNLPSIVEDELLFRVSLPDTSIITSAHPYFSSGFARRAVDNTETRGFVFDNDSVIASGDWYLYGRAGTFEPHEFNFRGNMGTKYGITLLAALHIKNDPQYSDHKAGVITGALMGSDVWHPYFDLVDVVNREFDVSMLSDRWTKTMDYIAMNYLSHDTLAIDLGNVLKFPLLGFDQAVDSVRAQCPVEQSIDAWNTARDSVFAFAECVDDIDKDAEPRETSSSCKMPLILMPSES